MATWTAATAIPSGSLITSAWMTNVTGAINFLGAANATAGKDLAYLRRTTTQSLTAGTWAAVGFNAEDFDVANGHDNTTNNSRYTAVAAGKYRLTGNVHFTHTTGTSALSGAFRKNGSGSSLTGFITGSAIVIDPPSAGRYGLVIPPTLVSLAAGDYVELMVNNSNASPAIDPTTYGVAFGIEWVGA